MSSARQARVINALSDGCVLQHVLQTGLRGLVLFLCLISVVVLINGRREI